MPRQSGETKFSSTQNNSSFFSINETLVEYSRHLRTWAGHAEALALMNRSGFLRDVFAFAATHEQLNAKDLWKKIALNEIGSVNLRHDWLYRLGRLLVFQGSTDQER